MQRRYRQRDADQRHRHHHWLGADEVQRGVDREAGEERRDAEYRHDPCCDLVSIWRYCTSTSGMNAQVITR